MQNLILALRALATHKMRTVLAMLGVFLGALVLTAILHISEALMLKADMETAQLGPNLVQAQAGQVRFFRGGGGGRQSGVRPITFTLADAEHIIETVPYVSSGVPYAQRTMPISVGSLKTTCRVVGTWPEYTQVRSFTPAYGRFITQEDEDSRVLACVLGYEIATRLFGTPEAALQKKVFFSLSSVPSTTSSSSSSSSSSSRSSSQSDSSSSSSTTTIVSGQAPSVRSVGFTVVGVMQQKGQDLSGTNQDEQTFIPLSSFMRRLRNQDHIDGAYLNIYEGLDMEKAKQSIEALLRERHRTTPATDDFSVFSAKDAETLKTEALSLVQSLGVISATVSFAVGGLGILSIMILLVRARRLEIGVRRAVGASKANIVQQFLTEAALMSGVGGALGVLVSLLIVSIIYQMGEFPSVYNPLYILGACGGSIIFGVLSGAYPAWQASRIEILDVLKSFE